MQTRIDRPNQWLAWACFVGLLAVAAVGRSQTTAATTSATTAATTAATTPAFPNLVHNPSFESGNEGWAFNVNDAKASGDLDSSEKHSGEKSFRMSFQSKFAPNVYERFAQGVGGLKPNTAYRISTFSKGKGVGIAWIGGGPGWFFRTRLPTGDYDWQETVGYYLTGENEKGFDLMVIIESPTQSLWIDDISMTEDPSKTQDLQEKRLAEQREREEKLRTAPKQQQARYETMMAQLERNPALRGDPYIRAGLAISKRFIDRVQAPDVKKKQGDEWSLMQMEEVESVLGEVEKLIAVRSGSPEGESSQAWPSGPVTIRDGNFVVNTTARLRPRTSMGERPWYFAGYGHFDQVSKDVPNFPEYGVSIVQDGRAGPSSMNEDWSLKEQALRVIENVQAAAKNRMKVDWLVSPHYFPQWAEKKGMNWQSLDDPRVREIYQRWMEQMADRMKDSPGLLSFCLSNEPTYQNGGRDPFSRPIWTAYLRRKYRIVPALNEMYGTKYKSFEEVAPPGIGWPKEVNAQRAYYDWVKFNMQHWADFHHWMHTVLKAKAPAAYTHAKIMVFFALDRDKLQYGVDPELFCEATDIAGCDNYANLTGGGICVRMAHAGNALRSAAFVPQSAGV